MKNISTSALFAAALISISTAQAADFELGPLVISEPYTPATPATARSGAGYLSITNNSDSDDLLVDVHTDFPKTQIHMTEVDGEGVARMHHMMGGLEIPAGKTVELKPKGMHVMFMGLSDPLEAGGIVGATLVFEKAGEIDIEFEIKPRDH